MTAMVLLPWEEPEFLGRERPPWGLEPRAKLCWISRELPWSGGGWREEGWGEETGLVPYQFLPKLLVYEVFL